MSRRVDGGSNDTAICHAGRRGAEAPASPVPEQDGWA
jgi:hypothetical protein